MSNREISELVGNSVQGYIGQYDTPEMLERLVEQVALSIAACYPQMSVTVRSGLANPSVIVVDLGGDRWHVLLP